MDRLDDAIPGTQIGVVVTPVQYKQGGVRGPLLDILANVDPRVDLVISGHTHRASLLAMVFAVLSFLPAFVQGVMGRSPAAAGFALTFIVVLPLVPPPPPPPEPPVPPSAPQAATPSATAK